MRSLVALSLRLKLSPQSRLANRDVGRQKPLVAPSLGRPKGRERRCRATPPLYPRRSGDRMDRNVVRDLVQHQPGAADRRATCGGVPGLDGGIEEDLTNQMAAYLTLVFLLGPEAKAGTPVQDLGADLFTLLGALGPTFAATFAATARRSSATNWAPAGRVPRDPILAFDDQGLARIMIAASAVEPDRRRRG